MSTFPRSLRAVVAGVIVAVASAVAMTAFAQPQMVRFGGHAGQAGPGAPGGWMGGPRMTERMLDSVNATEAQRAQIRQIMQGAVADLRAQREAARALREQAMNLFAQPTIDAGAAEALRQQMLAQHDQSSKRMLQAMLDASRVLTAEQRVQLGERIKQRREMSERHRRERMQLDQPKQ
jgi:protein CpxP